MNIGSSIKDTSDNRRICDWCPGGDDIASKQLWHACDSNAVLHADCFPCQQPPVRVSLDKKFMSPGLSEDLLFRGWTTDILSGVSI